MNKRIRTKRIFIIRMVILITFLLAADSQLMAQDVIKNFAINRYWGGVSEQGSKTNFNWTNDNLGLFADYAAYGARLQGAETNFGGFIAITQTNWTDPNGKVINTAVFTPTNSYLPNGKVISPLEDYVRYNNPVYTVENKDIGPIITDLGTVDPSKCIGTSDQTMIVTNDYANGIEIQRKILGWSQQFHDNYVVVDMTFTNKSDKPVTGMYVSIQDQTAYNLRADGQNPSVASVDSKGNSRWWHYIGSKTSDSVRVMYEYDGDDPNKPGDQMAQPLTQQNGRLLRNDFAFTATLWASKQPYIPSGTMVDNHDQNDVDDLSQPSVATIGNNQVLNFPIFPLNDPDSKTAYDFISGDLLSAEDQTGPDIRPGHFRKNLDDLGLVTAGGQPGISANADSWESLCLSYGPYDLQPGQQVRVVKVMGYAGISRKKALEVGKQWLTGTLTDPMPNKPNGDFPDNFAFPAGTTQQDKYKDKWFSTGIDSVILSVKRAIYNFKSGYNVPVTPPPPTSYTVLGTGEGIELTWSDPNAEAMNGFQGYRIMRKVSTLDTTYYQQVAAIPSSDKAATHKYTDANNILFGANYYYYIQAGVKIDENDQNAYPADRGKTIWSSRVWYPQNTPALPKRRPQNNLDSIWIAPNPYNFNDPNLKGYGFTDDRGILFFNLPSTVTIRIFSESGNLIKTIEHDDPITKSGSDQWLMINENRQPIASGIYIVVFQTPDGNIAYQKLVVAR